MCVVNSKIVRLYLIQRMFQIVFLAFLSSTETLQEPAPKEQETCGTERPKNKGDESPSPRR